MSRLRLSIPPEMKSWIDSRIAEGRHVNASDYVRDLLRRDQDSAPDYAEWLRERNTFVPSTLAPKASGAGNLDNP